MNVPTLSVALTRSTFTTTEDTNIPICTVIIKYLLKLISVFVAPLSNYNISAVYEGFT